MPELPEVETLVRRLREPVIGRTIEDVTIYWKRTDRPACAEGIRADAARLHRAGDRSAREVSGVHAARSRGFSRDSRERAEVSTRAASTPGAMRLLSSY